MKLEEFTAAALRPHVGSNFHVKTEAGPSFDLLLEEVKVVLEKHVSPRLQRDSFSLYFVGPENVFLQQSIYEVTHDELGGPWSMFLVPVGKRDATILYEAAFT